MNIMPQNISAESFPPFDPAMASVYRYRQQQSVNLGSWFVHERWMTPSLFTCASGKRISELDIASGWNSTDRARTVLEHHWNTFINQSDFQYLSKIGINTVRLPIGYWSLGSEFCQGTPFSAFADVYRNSWASVVRVINMAGAAGLGVLVDLHGAVGSQNGQPHSGISDKKTRLFNTPANMDKTLAVLTFLMQELCNVTNVVGIQILNEPTNVPTLDDFYTRAISTMRQMSNAAASFPLYIHDGFDLQRFSDFVASRTDFIVQDHHAYFVFTPSDTSEPASKHTNDIQTTISGSLAAACAHQRRNLVVDEFSCALTPQSLSNEPNEVKARQDFCAAQVETYSNITAGWSFWAYKKEDCDDDSGWCFTAAVGTSLPSTFFSYGEGGNPAQSIGGSIDLPPISDVLSNVEGSFALPGQAKRTALSSKLSRDWNFRRSISPFRHRLAAIHHRRSRRDPGLDMSAPQQSMTKGYSDGLLTAVLFASCGMSKLGFSGQYIADNIKALGPGVIAPGTESQYSVGFMRGLVDGEKSISSTIIPTEDT
ncbi:glycoside hydrolase superfamily [Mycena sp. CBHHK59/15]|nr:glycoside hydrolase superfamily [Mycena sp. CBHHK59/15]